MPPHVFSPAAQTLDRHVAALSAAVQPPLKTAALDKKPPAQKTARPLRAMRVKVSVAKAAADPRACSKPGCKRAARCGFQRGGDRMCHPCYMSRWRLKRRINGIKSRAPPEPPTR